MKTTLFLILFLIAPLFSTAQDSTFVPGYYIINSGAQYFVIQAGGNDYYPNGGCYERAEGLYMAAGEVVIISEFSKGIYYGFDPMGRMIAFKGKESLTKAPLKVGSGVGYMTEEIELIDGTTLKGGSYYWIIGQDLVNGSITIQVQNGITYNIPQSKIMLFNVRLKNFVKDEWFETAME